MKVLIIATNRERFPHAVAPLGAAHVACALQQAGHQAVLLDLGFQRRMSRAMQTAIERLQPGLIGFSIRNLDSCCYHQPRSFHHEALQIVDEVRRHSDAPLIAGGGAVSVVRDELLRHLGIRYGIAGEGEQSLPLFVAALERGEVPANIPGLIDTEANGSVCQAAFDIRLDESVMNPHDLIDYRKYYRGGGFVSLQTKRGCPFTCAYCNYPQLEGKRYRLRPPELCVDDMERFVKNRGLRDFFFSDSVFNLPRSHALAIAEEIIGRGLKIRWMAYCNPRGIDREVVKAFKASGCVGVELGLDAAIDKMIQNLGKNFTQKDVARAFAALGAEALPFSAFMLFGGPEESWQDIEETQRFLSSAGRPKVVVASLGIRIYRHTKVYQAALAEGLVTEQTPLLEPRYYVSRFLGKQAIARLDELSRKDSVWITPTDWNAWPIRMLNTLSHWTRTLPPWKDSEFYGRHIRKHVRLRPVQHAVHDAHSP